MSGIIETCKSPIRTFSRIFEIKKEIQAKIVKLGTKSEKAMIMQDYLYSHPIITSHDIVELLGVTPTTANSFIKHFIEMGILKEVTGFKRHKKYAFEVYLELFR